MSSELKTAYEYYQLLLQMYRKNSCQLLNLLTDTVSWNPSTRNETSFKNYQEA